MGNDAYQDAYDAASSELSEILVQFEQLYLRKQKVETAVQALMPLCVPSGQVLRPTPPRGNAPAESFSQQPDAAPIHSSVEMTSQPSAAQPMLSEEPESDPIQSRINRALSGWGLSRAEFSPAL